MFISLLVEKIALLIIVSMFCFVTALKILFKVLEQKK